MIHTQQQRLRNMKWMVALCAIAALQVSTAEVQGLAPQSGLTTQSSPPTIRSRELQLDSTASPAVDTTLTTDVTTAVASEPTATDASLLDSTTPIPTNVEVSTETPTFPVSVDISASTSTPSPSDTLGLESSTIPVTQTAPEATAVTSAETVSTPVTVASSTALTTTSTVSSPVATASTSTISGNSSSSGSLLDGCGCENLYRVSLLGLADYCLPATAVVANKCGNVAVGMYGECPRAGSHPCMEFGHTLIEDSSCTFNEKKSVYQCVVSETDEESMTGKKKKKKSSQSTPTAADKISVAGTIYPSSMAHLITMVAGLALAAITIA